MEFERWNTPFENEGIELLKVVYPVDLGPAFEKNIGRYERICLRVLLRTDAGEGYSLTFGPIVSFRVMDEIGFSHLTVPSHFYRRSARGGIGREGAKCISSLRLRGDDWLDPHTFEPNWRYLLLTGTDCIDIFASEVTVEAKELN